MALRSRRWLFCGRCYKRQTNSTIVHSKISLGPEVAGRAPDCPAGGCGRQERLARAGMHGLVLRCSGDKARFVAFGVIAGVGGSWADEVDVETEMIRGSRFYFLLVCSDVFMQQSLPPGLSFGQSECHRVRKALLFSPEVYILTQYPMP